MRSYGADVRRSAVVICVLVAGCSGDAGQPHRESAVTAKVDLDKPRAATTSSAVFTFSGKVSPPDSKVSVSDGAVRVEPSGRFTVAVASPRAGSKEVKLAATNPGSRSWRLNVRVARGQPKRVKVPERDVLAPTAGLLLEPGGGAPPSVQASPSRADDAPDVVTLSEPAFRATAVVRDAEGGTGRIRLAMEGTTRCGSTERPIVRLLPPAQIVRIAIPPGAWAPVERERSARFRLDVRPGCSVRGEVLAEGTDAHGLQAVTHHAGFRYPGAPPQ